MTGELGYVSETPSGYSPVSLTYDDLGRRSTIAKANGHGQSYGYDAASRLTAYATQLPGGTSSTWLSYNPASQIYSRSTSDEQLSSNVAYNVGRNYAANGLNQYTKAGAPGLGYDANGNLTRLASSTYAYDGDNLLTGGSAGAGLAYDALDRLYQSPDDNGTLWAYAGGMLAGEYTPSGALKRRYLPGDAGDEVLVWYEGAGLTRRYLATDERGSVSEVSDDGGATLAIDQYDDWGIPARGNLGRFGYTGQTWLPSVQAWNYKARLYNPVLGRFHQSDPIASEPHLYRYAGGDPIGNLDPSGTTCYKVTGSNICYSMKQDGAGGGGGGGGGGNGGSSGGNAVDGGNRPIDGTAPANGGPWGGQTVNYAFDPSGDYRLAGGQLYYNGNLTGAALLSSSSGGGFGPQNDDIVVTARCNAACRLNLAQLAQITRNNLFACGGFSVGVGGGLCFGGGQGFVYGSVGSPGPEFTAGYAPGGAASYLSGASAGANGLPGAGLSFTGLKPTANAWTVGLPGASATYGVSFGTIGNAIGRVGSSLSNTFSTFSNGFYNMAGRPYDLHP